MVAVQFKRTERYWILEPIDKDADSSTATTATLTATTTTTRRIESATEVSPNSKSSPRSARETPKRGVEPGKSKGSTNGGSKQKEVAIMTSETSGTKSVCCKLPPWQRPVCQQVKHGVGLQVMNSLTRQKELFQTADGSKNVKWYMCGPTVYAPSHMGHARTYLGFDIIRRILTSYFGYNVTLVMNITDIDDKIIQRASERQVECLDLTREFELEFHEDMAALGVRPPDILTRVTEYMEEIVVYIARIVERGLAYESNGSIYFDVSAFEQLEGMYSCKLEPEQKNNTELLAEGEGKLTQSFANEKRSPRDFALWKKSKEGEPTWDSPWGPGRPGWHIECSVMASDTFAKLAGLEGGASDPKLQPHDVTMDIHSGGVDLKFPHHDNEMAQAEAHAGCTQWVNYFIHSGHLHIKGFKMSKSLKNFITIRQALEQNTARQVRLCFLMHKYNAPMDYGDNTMSHALVVEKTLVEFFHNVKAVLRDVPITAPQRIDKGAQTLQRALQAAMDGVDAALKDDFDTPLVMNKLLDLVRATNIYLDSLEGQSDRQPVTLVLRNVATFVTRILRVFGLVPEGRSEIGFSRGDDAADGESAQEALTPVLDALMTFRSNVRDLARSSDTQGVLQECDAFRDAALPPLGIRLEDKTGGKSMWKLADPAELLQEMQMKRAEQERKAAEKAARAAETARAQALAQIPPIDYMKQLTVDDQNPTLKYTAFDQEGLPTHDADGQPLSKNQSKNAKKEFAAQQKRYDKWLKSQG